MAATATTHVRGGRAVFHTETSPHMLERLARHASCKEARKESGTPLAKCCGGDGGDGRGCDLRADIVQAGAVAPLVELQLSSRAGSGGGVGQRAGRALASLSECPNLQRIVGARARGGLLWDRPASLRTNKQTNKILPSKYNYK
eukprot:1187941-Prorocentrum_minimum.AAC.8